MENLLEEYQDTCCVITEYQSVNEMTIMAKSEIERTDTRNPILFTGTFDQCNEYVFTKENLGIWGADIQDHLK